MKDINDIYNGLRAPLRRTINYPTREAGFRYIPHGFEFGEGSNNYPHYYARITKPYNTWENKLQIEFSDTAGGYSAPLNFMFEPSTLSERLVSMDTPYYATKMQNEGIYEDYVLYRDELFEYEQEQRQIEQQRQEAYQQALEENPELTYEDWLSAQPMQMSIQVEPVPSKELIAFKEKYLG